MPTALFTSGAGIAAFTQSMRSPGKKDGVFKQAKIRLSTIRLASNLPPRSSTVWCTSVAAIRTSTRSTRPQRRRGGRPPSEGTLGGYNAAKGPQGRLPIDVVAIPFFRAILGVINLAKQFSPIDSLSTGRSITWGQLSLALGQIVLLLGGILGLFGIVVFTRRELATAQGTQ